MIGCPLAPQVSPARRGHLEGPPSSPAGMLAQATQRLCCAGLCYAGALLGGCGCRQGKTALPGQEAAQERGLARAELKTT